jgi:hypothetical protein
MSMPRRAGGRETHLHLLMSNEELGESPILPAFAILGSALLYATLPTRFISGPSSGVFTMARWIVPAFTLLLLVVLVASVPRGKLVRSLGLRVRDVHIGRRAAVLTVIGVISAANAASIVLLVHLLVSGAHAQASLLLRAALDMWCLNVLVFGLWFWELDNGGPTARQTAGPEGRDFLFPQQAQGQRAPNEWQPRFLDYLYVAFTNATAFSPTDTMPLTVWAKMLMLVQSAASLLLAIMVVARAVNILQ